MIHGQSGPTTIDTHLGWVLSGPVCSDANLRDLHYPAHSMLVHTSDASSMDNVLKKIWELESLGILPAEPSVYDTFKQSIKFDNGRYEVRLPWCSEGTQPPSNFQLAKRRLQGLLKRLRHNPEVLQEYNAIMQEQLKLGIIEKVSNDRSEATDNDIHYLPHHAVIRMDKQTTKIRIVYDASAQDKGISLNDCLLSGPKFEQYILDILLRFRTYRIALVADVEKAFLIAVSEDDRNALRFLWIDDVEKPQPELQQMKFTRVVFGVSASPFLLNTTISHHHEKYYNDHLELVNTLKRSIYVDDVTIKKMTLTSSIPCPRKRSLMADLTCVNSLPTHPPYVREFLKNRGCQRMLRSIVPLWKKMKHIQAISLILLTGSKPGGQKVLAVGWDPTSDMLLFDISAMVNSLQTLEPTKRSIVGVASRFYDPLGFLSPVIIMLKVFFQELCKIKLIGMISYQVCC